jgi:hypothetical protein
LSEVTSLLVTSYDMTTGSARLKNLIIKMGSRGDNPLLRVLCFANTHRELGKAK